MADKVDVVNEPPHYKNGKIEVIVAMALLGDATQWLSHALKYLCRAPHKGKEVEDLRKALFYLDKSVAAGAGWGKDLTGYKRREIADALNAGIPSSDHPALNSLRRVIRENITGACCSDYTPGSTVNRLREAVNHYEWVSANPSGVVSAS